MAFEKVTHDSEAQFEAIVLEQVKKITTLGSTDIDREGFYKYTIPAPGMKAQRSGYEPDAGKSYINAIDILEDLLMNRFNTDTKKRIAAINGKVTEVNKENINKRNRLIKLSRRKFQELNRFLGSLGWMSGESLSDV